MFREFPALAQPAEYAGDVREGGKEERKELVVVVQMRPAKGVLRCSTRTSNSAAVRAELGTHSFSN